jgi:dTDP-4-dehydrorhamnose 3,5-epimerase
VRFTELELAGVFLIELERIEDERGFFARAWGADELEERGLESRVAQCNLSLSGKSGTIRGLHFQRPPYEEVKLIRCLHGAFHDVVVDLRSDSSSYKRWLGVDLTAENRRMLYVPKGFAHGFQTLVDNTEAFYMVSEFFTPDAEAGVRYDDPSFGITWPLSPTVISDKDRSWPDYVG